MIVNTVGPPTAKIMLVGEAPGEQEDAHGVPFYSKAPGGSRLNSLLKAAGISRHECLIGNVARERPPGNKIAFYFEDAKCTQPKPILLKWVEELKHEIRTFRPNIVVALGATANWALLGVNAIQDYRGYIQESTLVPGVKVLPTYHPQKVNYEWKLHFPTVMDLQKARINSETPDLPKDNRRLNSTPSKREFIDYLHYLYYDHTDPIVVDIETTQPGSHIDILGFADSPEHAVSMKLLSGRQPRFSMTDELEIWKIAAKVLNKKPLIMHNGSYDAAVLYLNHGIYCIKFFFDTMVATHICWPEVPRSLGFLSSICLNVPMWKHTSSDTPALYNAADNANTYGCYQFMQRELIKRNAVDTFEFEMGQIEPAIFLQLQGLLVSEDKRSVLETEIEERFVSLKEELSADLKKPVIFHSSEGGPECINLNSAKQLQSLLYVEMNLPAQYKRRKSRSDPRKLTADEEALMKLSRISDNPTLLKIVEGKKLAKLRTFVDISVSPESKVHTSYNVTGATMARQKKGIVVDDEDTYRSFGRWSSSESIILPYGSGNLQNIPARARAIYIPPPGFEFVRGDYIQAEAVVVAYEIRDIKLMKMFRASFGLSPSERREKGFDVHKITASSMFGIPFDQVTPDQRQVGKVIRHATNYSAGPAVLAYKLGISMGEAKQLLQMFFNATPQLSLWHQVIQNELRATRTLKNLLGRRHKFLDRWPKPGQDGTLFRSAYSYKPQSTVGDLLNKSLCKFYYTYGEQRSIALQLHDAMYAYSPENDEEARMQTVKWMWECMRYPLTSTHGDEYIIDVDFAAGPSWGELEEIDVGTRDLQ